MSQIFISYSRKDLAIAEKIIDALAKDDLEPWIDWKSIPKGETFEAEIKQGIEKAEIFLFLVSPDSVQSYWCNMEIVHAVKNGKRILPIVIRDAELKIIHPEIAKRNWIFCRDEQDDFNKAIEETRKTIHTDYEWLKFHTNLQLKALEWERNDYEYGFLLHGKELENSEKIFVANLINEPFATELQNQYVAKSRISENLQLAEKNKARSRLRNLGIVLGVIAVLTIWFGSQVGSAKIAEQQANATAQAESTSRAQAQAQEQLQRQIALARNLAELARKLGLPDSQIFLGRDAPSGNAQSIATLLAVESVKRNPTTEGSQALIGELNHLPRVVTRQNFSTDGFVTALENAENEKFTKIYISPDQTQVFKLSKVTQTNYALYRWRVSDWQATESTDILVPEETGLTSQPPVVLSNNTEWFSYIGRDGIVIQRSSQEFPQLIWKTSGPFSALQFSPDSNFLMSSKRDGTIKVWSVDSLQEVTTITASVETDFVSFNGDGSLLIVETGLIGENRYDVYVYDIQSKELLHSFHNSSYLGSNDMGNLLALSFDNQQESDNIHIWNVTLNAETYAVKNECLLSFIHGLENILTVSKGKNVSCFSGLGNPIHIFDLNRKEEEFERELDGLVWATEINSDGTIAAVSTGRTVYIIDMKTNKVLTEITLDFMADTFEFSPDGSELIIANKSPLPIVDGHHSFNAIIWDLKNNLEVGRIPSDNFIYSIAFLGEGSKVIIADYDGNLTVWAIKDFWKHKVFEFQHDQPAAMPGSVASNWTFAIPVYSSTGKQLAIGGGNGKLETFDTLSGQQIFSFSPIDMTLSEDLAYSPDEKWLAFTGLFCQQGSCPNNVKVVDVVNNSYFVIDQMEPTYTAKMAFSPDNRYLAIIWSGTRNLLHVWDTSQWRIIREIDTGPQGWQSAMISFTPDGERLVLANPAENGYLLMFDVSSWRQVFELNSGAGPFAFFGEDRILVTSSYDSVNLKGIIRIINTSSNKEDLSFQYDTQISAIAFSSDGNYVSAIDYLNNLITWETSTGHLVSTKFIPDIGSALIASPDHPSWFFVNSGNDILIVDVFNGAEIQRIVTGEYISALAISPDGKYIASGGANGKVQAWYWRPEDLITEACSRLPRNLTQTEWKQYLGNEPYRPTCPNLSRPTE